MSDDDVYLNILPVAHLGREPVSVGILGRFGYDEHLVEQDPLVIDGVRFGELVRDVEGCGQRPAVGGPHIEGDGEAVVPVGELPEGVEGGVDKGSSESMPPRCISK